MGLQNSAVNIFCTKRGKYTYTRKPRSHKEQRLPVNPGPRSSEMRHVLGFDILRKLNIVQIKFENSPEKLGVVF